MWWLLVVVQAVRKTLALGPAGAAGLGVTVLALQVRILVGERLRSLQSHSLLVLIFLLSAGAALNQVSVRPEMMV
jgi:hypothetical protein